MRSVLLLVLLAGCATGPVERPADWRHLVTTPDMEARYDLANVRFTDKGLLMVKVRMAPTRPAAFTHEIATIALECKERRYALVENSVFNGTTVVGHQKAESPYFLTIDPATMVGKLMEQGCVRFKDA